MRNLEMKEAEKKSGSRAFRIAEVTAAREGAGSHARLAPPIDLPFSDCEEMRRKRRKRPPNFKARQIRIDLGMDFNIRI